MAVPKNQKVPPGGSTFPTRLIRTARATGCQSRRAARLRCRASAHDLGKTTVNSRGVSWRLLSASQTRVVASAAISSGAADFSVSPCIAFGVVLRSGRRAGMDSEFWPRSNRGCGHELDRRTRRVAEETLGRRPERQPDRRRNSAASPATPSSARCIASACRAAPSRRRAARGRARSRTASPHRPSARHFISGNTALKTHAHPAPRRLPAPVPIEDIVVPISLNVLADGAQRPDVQMADRRPGRRGLPLLRPRNWNSLPYCEYHSRVAYQPADRRRDRRSESY